MKRSSSTEAETPLDTKRSAKSFLLTVDFAGRDVVVELPAAGPPTSKEVCEAVACALGLHEKAFTLQHNGAELDDGAAEGLVQGARLTVVVNDDARLAVLVRRIAQAAAAAGRADDFNPREGADDETIENLKEKIVISTDIELLLRCANGVGMNCVDGCGLSLPSVGEMLEIYDYNPQLTEHFDRYSKRCVPWMSVDCEFCFLVLEIAKGGPYLWMYDWECNSTRCFGKLEDQLQALLEHFENEVPGKMGPKEASRRVPFELWSAEEDY